MATPHTNFNEDAIVSIANALTLYTGLSDHASLLDKLEEARRADGAIKPGLSLYPPYPAGIFAYAQMAEGQYQNGACGTGGAARRLRRNLSTA